MLPLRATGLSDRERPPGALRAAAAPAQLPALRSFWHVELLWQTIPPHVADAPSVRASTAKIVKAMVFIEIRYFCLQVKRVPLEVLPAADSIGACAQCRAQDYYQRQAPHASTPNFLSKVRRFVDAKRYSHFSRRQSWTGSSPAREAWVRCRSAWRALAASLSFWFAR